MTPEQRLLAFQQEFIALEQKYGVSIAAWVEERTYQNGQRTSSKVGWDFVLISDWEHIETVQTENGKKDGVA